MLRIAVADPAGLLILAVLIAVIVAAYGVYSLVWSAGRKRAAAQLGFTPVATGDAATYGRLQALYASSGQRVRVSRAASRSDDTGTLLSYDVWASGDRGHSSAVAVLASQPLLPAFSIVATGGMSPRVREIGESGAAALAGRAEPHELRLTTSPEFSRRFAVIGQDEPAIARLLQPALTDWLVEIAADPGMNRIAIVADEDILTWSWHDPGLQRGLNQAEGLRLSLARLLELRRLLTTVP